MGDLMKWTFSSTVKYVRKCGGEWVKWLIRLQGLKLILQAYLALLTVEIFF